MSTHSDTFTAPGLFSTGKAPVSQEVAVRFLPEGMSLTAEGWPKPRVWAYADLTTSNPIHSGAGEVLLRTHAHEGETLFIAAPGIGAEVVKHAPNLSLTRTRLRWARPGLAVLACAALVATAMAYSGFSPAQSVARVIPKTTREAMGQAALTSIAGQHRRCTTPEGSAALAKLTDRLTRTAGTTLDVKVDVLDWGLVNAFALPGGQIILTRGLLQTAGSADEVAGVLAHELGHSIELHPETGLVRAVGMSAAAELIFAGSSGAATNIGLLVTQIQYTRIAEHEADQHAVRLLRNAQIPAKGFGDFFKRIDSPAEKSIFNNALIRTHPLTKDRIDFVRNQPAYTGTPALADAEWKALKTICGGRAPTRPEAKAGLKGETKPGTKPTKRTTPDTQTTQAEELVVAETTRALEDKPDDVTLISRRARAYASLRRYDLALADWTTATRLKPDDPDLHVSRGRVLETLYRQDEAMEAYAAALKVKADHAPALNRRAIVNRALKRPVEAIADLDRLLAADPKYTVAHYNRGLLLLDLDRTEEAFQAFNAAIELDKDYAAAYTQRGLLHESAGRKDAAIADFRFALAATGVRDSTTWGQRLARERLARLETGSP